MSLSIGDKIGQRIKTPDRQSTSLANSRVIDESFSLTFREKFDGMEILNDRVKIEAISSLVNVIKVEHKKQIDTVIAIGRAFTRTEKVLSPSEWRHLLRYTQELFGMTRHTACMYRSVAKAIDHGRLPRDICPPSHSTAYALTTLPENKLKNAIKNGKITPKMTRKDVLALKSQSGKKEKKETPPNPLSQLSLNALKAEQDRLYDLLEAIENEISIRCNPQKTRVK